MQEVDSVEPVATAPVAARARGVVHRDLTPANIWLEPDDGNTGRRINRFPRRHVPRAICR
jgi:serine/threonine protein kinase